MSVFFCRRKGRRGRNVKTKLDNYSERNKLLPTFECLEKLLRTTPGTKKGLAVALGSCIRSKELNSFR
jgi:hypothetical protein